MDNQTMGLVGFVVVCMLFLLWAISGKHDSTVAVDPVTGDPLIEEVAPVDSQPKREDTNTIIKRSLQPNP